MLKRLRVSNLAIVELAEADFAAGLNVITGETGSGKSVLMGALELVLGGKADASVVRDGAKEAEVEAEFDNRVIRRTITSNGRTRAWIDDESVSVAELKELGRKLVDIHGPRSNQLILEERFQRETLDAFGGISWEGKGSIGARYDIAYQSLCDIRSQISELQSSSTGNIEEELDMLRFQVNELETAEITEEDETIVERHAAAAHAEEIVGNANVITDALGGDNSAAEILMRLQPKFRELSRHMPEAAGWAEQAEDITIRLQELSRSIADVASRIDVGEEDLDELDRRLTLINRLKRKYGAVDVQGLMSVFLRKKSRLADLEGRDEKLAELQSRLADCEIEVRRLGEELTKERGKVAEKLSRSVTRGLRDLGFLQARFSVAMERIEPESRGCDRVVYMFEPNPGESARPLAAIASSGETARVMLALKSVLAAHDAVDVLVFDEIDANIGGEVGKVVGEKLRAVAKHHQVIAITHLPQSAVYGERHLVVSKAVSGGRTRTRILEVNGESRIAEIARMLGGEKLTSVVKRHAEELLELSGGIC